MDVSMRIFPPPLEIGEYEGFTPEKDIFGRQALGTGMTNLLSTVTDPMVLALDAQWGSGKTTFLRMWAGQLRNAGFPVVYFDAFESDYIDDAFAAIAGQIIELAQEKRKEGEPAAKHFVDKAFGAGRVILRSGLKVAVKVGSGGALNAAGLGEEFKDAIGQISTELRDVEDKYLGELLTNQREQKDAITAFQESLTELPPLLSTADAEPRPLVFIIDELDRCRPGFALQVIERIKHFFSVQNVHFVLGVHLGQLRNSVKAAYGGGIDAQLYLQKFIHMTFHLVTRARHPSERDATKFVEYLSRILEIKAEHQALSAINATVAHVAHRKELSLRTIERIMVTVAVAFAFSTTNQLRVRLETLRVGSPS
jgi:predicted KAP-like P-loop ATPase